MDTRIPLSTAQVRDLLGLDNDKRLNDLVRTGRIRPAPRVVSGRRLWEIAHVTAAANALGIPVDDVRRRLESGDA